MIGCTHSITHVSPEGVVLCSWCRVVLGAAVVALPRDGAEPGCLRPRYHADDCTCARAAA